MTRSRARGFTLIELLVVIGIILVLVAMVVMGLRHVNYTAARQETIAELKICDGLLSEYQNVKGYQGTDGWDLPNIDDQYNNAPASTLTLPSPWPTTLGKGSFPLPIYMDPQPPYTSELSGPPESALQVNDFSATQETDMGDRLTLIGPRYQSPAVQNTTAVMYILLKVARNRSEVAGVTSKRILEEPNTSGTNPPPSYPADASVLLDGWANPIDFVPRGGMHVLINPIGSSVQQEYIVRSSGIFSIADIAKHPLGPADHPFFASAGQDGNFTDQQGGANDYGSDNMYSFQN